MAKTIKEEESKLSEGEHLSVDRKIEIFFDYMRLYRA